MSVITEFMDPRDKPIRYLRSEKTVNDIADPRVMTPAQRRNGKLTNGQKKLAGAAFLFGVVVTVAGWATNFLSVSAYAKHHHFVIPQALPIGLDLAIPTLLVIDYLATVKGANAAFLRWAAWALTGFTVYAGAVSANGDHKGTDWNSTILHGVMPAISVVFIEAARWFRMWLDGLTDGTHTDRIPIARWICAPIRTARMRRRMVLWNEKSYPMAVVREAALLYARALLEGEGRTWRTTPVSLRHQVRTGQVSSIVVHAMRGAVENGDESWQPAVEEWVSDHLTKLSWIGSEGGASETRNGSESGPVGGSEDEVQNGSETHETDRSETQTSGGSETGPGGGSETQVPPDGGSGSANGSETSGGNGSQTGPKKRSRRRSKIGPKAKVSDRLAEAQATDKAYLADHGRHIPAEKLAKALAIGKPAALDLVKQVRGGHIDIAK